MTRTRNAQEKGIKLIPGLTGLLSKRPDLFSDGIWPTYYKKAKGAEIWDLDDRHYIDMSIGGIGANILGYCDPDIDTAVVDAIRNCNSTSLNCYEEVLLAEVLCDLHPWADNVKYARTGGEAMAMAVRIARACSGKDVVAFCGYHGWHDWYLAANLNHDKALDGHLLPGLEPKGVPRSLFGTSFPFAYNRLEDLEKLVSVHGEKIGVITMEPIRNFEPEPGFIEGVRDIANRLGAVLIVDEISAGFRFNTGGAHLEFFPENCMPDIAVFSKALGNGYPIAAVIGKGPVMECAQDTFISSTYWTERIGPVAALAMLHKHKKLNVPKHLINIGSSVESGWQKAAKKTGLDIDTSGIKQMVHFSFNYEESMKMKAFFIQKMLEKGFLASNVFYAMYAHTNEHVERYLEAVETAFEDIRKALDDNSLDQQLKGKPSQQGFKRIA